MAFPRISLPPLPRLPPPPKVSLPKVSLPSLPEIDPFGIKALMRSVQNLPGALIKRETDEKECRIGMGRVLIGLSIGLAALGCMVAIAHEVRHHNDR